MLSILPKERNKMKKTEFPRNNGLPTVSRIRSIQQKLHFLFIIIEFEPYSKHFYLVFISILGFIMIMLMMMIALIGKTINNPKAHRVSS